MKIFVLVRTMVVVLIGYAFTFAGLFVVLHLTGGKPEQNVATIATSYFSAIGFLAAAIALKSAMEHAAGGGGIGGMIGSIFTSRKPEPPAGPPAPPVQGAP